MNQNLAKFLSVLAHPVFVNLLSLVLMFQLFPVLNHGLPSKAKLFFIAFIFISTSLVPSVFVLIMRVTGMVKTIMLKTSQERRLPYLITLCMYLFNYYNFEKSSIAFPTILHYLLACSTIVLLVMIINFFTKISIHMATLGGLAGLIATVGFAGSADVRVILAVVIILIGLIGSARLSLEAHFPMQLYSGFLMGFVLMFLIMSFTFA